MDLQKDLFLKLSYLNILRLYLKIKQQQRNADLRAVQPKRDQPRAEISNRHLKKIKQLRNSDHRSVQPKTRHKLSNKRFKNTNQQRNVRRWAVQPGNRDRISNGHFKKTFLKMKTEDEDQFFEYTRMSPNVYDLLVNLVGTKLQNPKQQIGSEERLSITLLYLSNGASFQSIARTYKLGKTTVRNIVLETCQLLWHVLSPMYVSEPTTSQYKEIADDFNKLWDMPHCVGAIDGKHIDITCPKQEAPMFLNKKGFYSIVLMATCDAKYTFTKACIGSHGGQSDGGVFEHSNFGRALLANELPLPPKAALSNSSTESLPYFFVGDTSFPLKMNLMRPYSGSQIPQNEDVFNYRLLRARRIIENSFGIMTARWRVLTTPLECSPKNCETIVLGCVVLHNFVMLNDNERRYCPDEYADWEDTEHNVQNGNWRNDLASVGGPLHSITSHRRNASALAYELRNKLAQYFMNEGAVPFQYR